MRRKALKRLAATNDRETIPKTAIRLYYRHGGRCIGQGLGQALYDGKGT
jgi:hypothetical protein